MADRLATRLSGLRGGGGTRGCRPSSPSSNSSACNSSAASLLWSSSSSGSLHWHVREGAAQQVKSRGAEQRRSERCWQWPQVAQQCDLTKYPSSAASIQGVLPSSPPHRASAIWARRREPRGTVAVKASMQETCRCVKQSARDRPRPFFHKWAADLARPACLKQATIGGFRHYAFLHRLSGTSRSTASCSGRSSASITVGLSGRGAYNRPVLSGKRGREVAAFSHKHKGARRKLPPRRHRTPPPTTCLLHPPFCAAACSLQGAARQPWRRC